ncbi:MAG: radical SAM protein [Candidatus Freyarchaeota archaeon]|nr:radical SAM protein [Candidatus Bathyarchaeota archaeon]
MKVLVSGVVELSLVDYPRNPALVIFVPGCPFRCPMCHNWRMLEVKPEHEKAFDELLSKLKRAIDAVEAVKVSGGEPTLYPDFLRGLSDFCKENSLLFGFDTNGYFPEVVGNLLGHVDLVSVDVKAAFNDPDLYSKVIGVNAGAEAIKRLKKTLTHLFSSSVYADLRTTFIPTVNDKPEHMRNIGETLLKLGYGEKAERGEASYTLQEFEPNLAWKDEMKRLRRPTLEEMVEAGKATGIPNVYIRKQDVGFMAPLESLLEHRPQKIGLI